MNPINVTGYVCRGRPICGVAMFPVDCDRSTTRQEWKALHRSLRTQRRAIEKMLADNRGEIDAGLGELALTGMAEWLINPPLIVHVSPNAPEGTAK